MIEFNIKKLELKKTLLAIIIIWILIFFFKTINTFADNLDDIRDFQIEEISIGTSLLEIASKKEIKKAKSPKQYPNDKFIIYKVEKLKSLKNYDSMTVTVKKNDNSYIIANISGAIKYEKLERCLELKKEIEKDVESLFKSDDKQETNYSSKQDKTGDSKVIGVQYYLKPYPSNEGIVINCYHMTVLSNVTRALKVSVNTEEYAYFLINEAYNTSGN